MFANYYNRTVQEFLPQAEWHQTSEREAAHQILKPTYIKPGKCPQQWAIPGRNNTLHYTLLTERRKLTPIFIQITILEKVWLLQTP